MKTEEKIFFATTHIFLLQKPFFPFLYKRKVRVAIQVPKI